MTPELPPPNGLIDAVGKMLGITWHQVGAWIGPAVAAAWFWSGQAWTTTSDELLRLPPQTPVAWFESAASRVGLDPSWPQSLADLIQGPMAFWIILLGAVAASSTVAPDRAAMSTIASLLLLLALSNRLAGSTLLLFLGLSACVPLLSLAVDRVASLADDSEALFHPSLVLVRWISGPLLMLGSALLLPLLPLLAAVNAYRVTAVEPMPEFDLSRAIQELPDVPIGELSATEAMPILTASLMLAGEPGRRPTIARWVLRDHADRRAALRHAEQARGLVERSRVSRLQGVADGWASNPDRDVRHG